MCRPMRRLQTSTLLAAALFLAACATAPDPVDPGLPPETVIAQALSEQNPYTAERQLSGLLDRDTLTTEQKVQALYHRGSLRRQSADNRRGAVEDFEAMLALAPDHALAANARTELDYARTDVERIETSMNRFLNLPDWFDGMWVLGEHEAAVARFRDSGLAPTPEQVEKLIAAGYVCDADNPDARLHTYGDDRDDLKGLDWCAALTG